MSYCKECLRLIYMSYGSLKLQSQDCNRRRSMFLVYFQTRNEDKAQTVLEVLKQFGFKFSATRHREGNHYRHCYSMGRPEEIIKLLDIIDWQVPEERKQARINQFKEWLEEKVL